MPTIYVNGGTVAQDPAQQVVALDFPQGACEVTAVEPEIMDTGFRVKITGTAFGASQGTGGVTIASTSQTIVSWSDTEIIITADVDHVTRETNAQLAVTTDDACIGTDNVYRAGTCDTGDKTVEVLEHISGNVYKIRIKAECIDDLTPTPSAGTDTVVDEATVEVTGADFNTYYELTITGLGTVFTYQEYSAANDIAQELVSDWNANSNLSAAYTASRSGATITLTHVNDDVRWPESKFVLAAQLGTGTMSTPTYTGDEETVTDYNCVRSYNLTPNTTWPCGFSLGAIGAGFDIPPHNVRTPAADNYFYQDNVTLISNSYNLPTDGSIVGCTLDFNSGDFADTGC